ncbi:glycosyltransferase family 47 protein [Rubrivivax sp. JA1024]|nr:glycosyltransferase family 47 protein [Rubrivivax sp. JA1024]
MAPLKPAARSWWFGRFQLLPRGNGRLVFRDHLRGDEIELPETLFSGLQGPALERAWCRAGFAGAAVSLPGGIAERPRTAEDLLFWQFPCRTEGAAWDLHATARDHGLGEHEPAHVYCGLPWATWIDKARKLGLDLARDATVQAQLRLIDIRLGGLRAMLAGLGVELRVHTVCQHIYWPDLLPLWRRLGMTDLWLSHCPRAGSAAADDAAGLVLHPWHLFAVNVEDPQRRAGLDVGRDPAQRPLLASFVGAHAAHYLSDIRLRLKALDSEADIVVRVTDRWHFEDTVYGRQILGQAAAPDDNGDSVRAYNQLLSDSVFSLCPAGAGANTLRLWESLASGAIPVLLGDQPELPRGGTLRDIDWDTALLRWNHPDLGALADFLRAMPLDERRRRQQCGLLAYQDVRRQRCF